MVPHETFLSAYHQSLTDDLNHISAELMRAKWFFLATIGAAGIAYWNLHNVNVEPARFFLRYKELARFQEIGYFTICLTGNIIFWLISEYSLSHAFLFRNIQTRLVGIERKFDEPRGFNNPTEIDNFIYYDEGDKKHRLLMEYIIPDQFVPIYWAATWLIIVNTIVSVYLQNNINLNEWKSTAYILISVPLIWKLWTYYCYKLDKFINENCTFKILYKTKDQNNNHYYRIRTFSISLGGALIFAGIYWLTLFGEGKPLELYPFLFFIMSGWFWPVYVGLLFHIFRLALQWQLHEDPSWLKKIFPNIFPEVKKIRRHRYLVNCNFWTRIFYVLYSIS